MVNIIQSSAFILIFAGLTGREKPLPDQKIQKQQRRNQKQRCLISRLHSRQGTMGRAKGRNILQLAFNSVITEDNRFLASADFLKTHRPKIRVR